MAPSTPRKQPRQRRSRVTVEVILEAAARVFDAVGFHEASTNRVAECAGVGIGSLYQYFPDKAALVTALHEKHVEAVSSALQACMVRGTDAAPDSPAIDALIGRFVVAALAAHRERPGLQQVLHRHLPQLATAPADSSAKQALRQALADALSPHQDQLGGLNIDVAATTLLTMGEALVHAAVLDGASDRDDAEVAANITRALQAYLRAP